MSLAKLQEIYGAALEIEDQTERRALLDSACAEDVLLRQQVEALLAAQSPADDFFTECIAGALASPGDLSALAAEEALSPPEAEAGDHEVGSRIGPYKLLERLGEGGCGTVYLAEQEKPVRRQVALKIIKLGMDTKNVIARFQAEQQALALMDHPNIARVLDAGATTAGRPYFVMELVHGTKVTAYCDQQHLDTRQRLKLFIQVCHAIQHAHQKGIIHRDIKPSNILVATHDGMPMPMVIDFGIAKAIEGRLTEQTFVTPHEQFIGTPAYMSPEQAELSRLDVDTRSDIYSLGILLYELLTGRTPFDQGQLLRAGLEEMRRTLREREPARPSTALRTLRAEELTQTAQARQVEPLKLVSLVCGDLDWIVMKAVEKDRNRRYQTANALALDVQRYLDNEPVLARPPSRLYRFQKIVRRNKILFVAAGLVTAALVTSSTVSTWLYVRERESRRRASEAEQQRKNLQQETVQLRQTTEDSVKLSRAIELFRQEKLAQADALIGELRSPRPAPEYAPTYRALGDWHVANGRWTEALARFAVLYQINQTEPVDAYADDARYAVLLVDQGKLDGYDRFREALISRNAGTDDAALAERIIRECLLTAASQEMLSALESFAAVARVPLEDKGAKPLPRHMASYYSYSLALLEYRRGDYPAAVRWCDQALDYHQGINSRDASLQLVRAMARARLGKMAEARAELAAARLVIEEHFKGKKESPPTSSWQGFWFDWVCARVHLTEAEALIARSADEPQPNRKADQTAETR